MGQDKAQTKRIFELRESVRFLVAVDEGESRGDGGGSGGNREDQCGGMIY